MGVPQSLPEDVAALLKRMVAVDPVERPTLLGAFNELLELHAALSSQGHRAEHLTTAWGALMHEGRALHGAHCAATSPPGGQVPAATESAAADGSKETQGDVKAPSVSAGAPTRDKSGASVLAAPTEAAHVTLSAAHRMVRYFDFFVTVSSD